MRGKPKLIKRTDSPFWFIYVPQQGKQPASRLSTGEADYRKAEEIFAQWIIEGRKPDLNDSDTIQVNDMLRRYAEYKSKDDTVQYHMRRLLPYFEGQSLSAFTPQTSRDYVKHRCSTYATRGKAVSNKKVSLATVRRELDTLVSAFNFSKNEGYISEVPKIEKPKASPPRSKWLTEDELKSLLDASERPYFKTYVMLALFTAARPSSILDLKWSQIDLDSRVIHFNPEGREQTKKHRPSISINSALLPHLIEAKSKTSSIYVISTSNGVRVRSIKRAFKAACDRAAIDGATPYTLRHTAITMIIRGGFSLAQAGQVAGHKDPRTTMRYAKHDPSFTQDAVEFLATGSLLAQFSPKKAVIHQITPNKKEKIQ